METNQMETAFLVDTKMDTKFYIALAQADIAVHLKLAVGWRIFHNAEM